MDVIHRWWKFDVNVRTKHLPNLLSSCVRHAEIDEACLFQQIEFLKTYVPVYNQFMTHISLGFVLCNLLKLAGNTEFERKKSRK